MAPHTYSHPKLVIFTLTWACPKIPLLTSCAFKQETNGVILTPTYVNSNISKHRILLRVIKEGGKEAEERRLKNCSYFNKDFG